MIVSILLLSQYLLEGDDLTKEMDSENVQQHTITRIMIKLDKFNKYPINIHGTIDSILY